MRGLAPKALQFTLYVLATVWFLQRGSPESKELDKAGGGSDEEQKIGRHADASSPRWARVGGMRTHIYSNSLLIAMGTIWILSWLARRHRADGLAARFTAWPPAHQLAEGSCWRAQSRTGWGFLLGCGVVHPEHAHHRARLRARGVRAFVRACHAQRRNVLISHD